VQVVVEEHLMDLQHLERMLHLELVQQVILLDLQVDLVVEQEVLFFLQDHLHQIIITQIQELVFMEHLETHLQ